MTPLKALLLTAITIPAALAQQDKPDALSQRCYEKDAQMSIAFSQELSSLNAEPGKKDAAAIRYYTAAKKLFEGECAGASQAAGKVERYGQRLKEISARAK